MKMLLLGIMQSMFICVLQGAEPFREQAVTYAQQQFLNALRLTESGNAPVHKVRDGDGGRAIGPYQIHRSYWKDACQYNPALASRPYEDCRNEAYAREVVISYFLRYARKAWEDHDFATLARIHNGGPAGTRKPSTLVYWQRVQLNASRLNQQLALN